MISLDERLTRSGDLAWRMYGDEAVLMSEDGSQIHMLNKVASCIGQLANGKSTVDEMVTAICDRFDVERDAAQADTLEFAQQLADKRLIQPDNGS